jgi:hypothetical protein
MTNQRLTLLFVILLAASSTGWGQTAGAAVTTQDIYRNFIGTWAGISDGIVNGRHLPGTEDLVITEIPKKHSIRMDSVYKGEKRNSKSTRIMRLDAAKEMMEMHWAGDSGERYETSGLKQFDQTGAGDFTATRSITNEHGEKEMSRVTFHLERDAFEYKWARSSDGVTYTTYSMFSFVRKHSSDEPGLKK